MLRKSNTAAQLHDHLQQFYLDKKRLQSIVLDILIHLRIYSIMDSDPESSEVIYDDKNFFVLRMNNDDFVVTVSTVFGSTWSGWFEFLSMYMLLSSKTMEIVRDEKFLLNFCRFVDFVGIEFEQMRMDYVLPVEK